MSNATNTQRDSVILFDGVCGLCDRLVGFVIARDLYRRFRFASLQSPAGQRLLRRHGLPSDELDTFVLVENGRAYVRSTAALRVLRRLPPPWPLSHLLHTVPLPVRDAVYRFIARNRHRVFGQRQSCRMPSPDERNRFLAND